MTGPTVLEFDSRDIACDSTQTRHALWALHRAANGSYNPLEAQAVLDTLTPLLEDGDELHRQLLAAAKAHRYTWLSRPVRDALPSIRTHSHLYGRRTCACLSGAWDAFRGAVDRALDELNAIARPGVLWAADLGGRHVGPFPSPVTTSTLAMPQGRPGDPLRMDPSRERRSREVVVRVAVIPPAASGARPRVELASGRGTDRRVLTLQALTSQESGVASLLRHGVAPRRPNAASEIVDWACAPLVTILADSRPSRQSVGALAGDLLDAGFLDLPGSTQEIAARLAEGWHGSGAELVIAASVTDGTARKARA